MTAVNVLVRDDCAVIITDTKAITSDGQSFNVSKVRTFPHMRLAVATRGRLDALDKVALALQRHVIDVDTARTFLDNCFAGLDLGEAEVFVAGYGENGPAAFMISSVNTGGKVVDIPYVSVTPTVSPEEFDHFTDDPIRNMPDLLAAQQRSSDAVGGWINVCQVGEAVIESYTTGMLSELAWRVPLAA